MTELERIMAERLTPHRRCPCHLSEDELIRAHGIGPTRFDLLRLDATTVRHTDRASVRVRQRPR